MASTFTDLGLELMATGENAGTWGTKTNANLSLIEQLTGGVLSLSIAGGAGNQDLTIVDGNVTGTAQQRILEFTGTISGARVIRFPLLTETFYFIKNGTSGEHTVQIKAVSGSGATVTFATGDKGYKIIYFDGVATNTGAFEVPLGTADAVTLTGTQTLTNKTLTTPVLTTPIANAGIQLKNGASSAGFLQFFEDSDNGTNTLKLIGPASTGDVTVTLPAATDTLVGKATTDTLSNKTINASQLVDGSVATGKVADNAITLAKMASGTDGNIISYDTSGNPVAVATGSSGQVLTSAGAGAVPSFQAAGGGAILKVYSKMFEGGETLSGTFSETAVSGYVTATITPVSSSSKFLIQWTVTGSNSDHTRFQVKRNVGGSVELIGVGKTALRNDNTAYDTSSFGEGSQTNQIFVKTVQYWDQPATGSDIYWQLFGKQDSGTFYFGASRRNPSTPGFFTLNTVTVWEIDGSKMVNSNKTTG